jgi:hypothetical protein
LVGIIRYISAYLPFYALGFAREWLVTFTAACWKLVQPQRLKMISLANEFAFVVLLVETHERVDFLLLEALK